MSASSSSDSWILIAVTFLVVLLLFYLSKKMICNSYGSSGGDGGDSPTTTSPSSSTTSTSFSDYLYGGYEGRSPLDLLDAAAITTSNGSSPDSADDLAIDIADSYNYPNHHYRSDNPCSNNNNNNNEIHNHSRNNLHLSNSVTTSYGRRMSCDGGGGGRVGGGGAPAIIGSGIIDGNNRGMDFGGSPPPPTLSSSSATTTGSQQPILSPISIIAGPAFERKTMLEIQLRNQIAKIVQAEREIQRLVQLLSLEQQRQGLDVASNNMLAAARASLLQHHQRYPQLYRHLRGIQQYPPSAAGLTTSITSPSSSTEPESTTTDATAAASASTSCNNSYIKSSNIPSLSRENVFTANMATTAATLPDNHGNDDDHQNPTNETTLPGNHSQQQHLCHSHHHSPQHQNDENLLANSNPIENLPAAAAPAQHRHHHNQILSCGLNGSSIVNFHHHHQQQQRFCACNLCFNGTGTRRMLMLRRMLLPLPISTFPIDTNANPTQVAMASPPPAVAASRGDFLTRSLDPLAHDLHYPREGQRQQQQHHHHRRHIQSVPAEPQSGFSDYSHQHQHHPDNYYHHHHQQNHHLPDDDPPPYEECIRSPAAAATATPDRSTLRFDENQNQDLYNNNYSNPDTSSSRDSNTTGNNRENRVEQTNQSMSVPA